MLFAMWAATREALRRDVTDFLQKSIVLGGPGIEVHMDESLFRHKPKVLVINFNYNKKNNHSVDCSCIESQRMSNHSPSLGVSHSRYFSHFFPGVHAACSKQNCYYTPAHYQKTCC